MGGGGKCARWQAGKIPASRKCQRSHQPSVSITKGMGFTRRTFGDKCVCMRERCSRVCGSVCFLINSFHLNMMIADKTKTGWGVWFEEPNSDIFLQNMVPSHLSPFPLLSPGGLCWLGIGCTHSPCCHGDALALGLDSAPHTKTGPCPSLNPSTGPTRSLSPLPSSPLRPTS